MVRRMHEPVLLVDDADVVPSVPEAADHGELQHDQPAASREQPTRQLLRRPPVACEKRPGAGQKKERRSAQVRDSA